MTEAVRSRAARRLRRHSGTIAGVAVLSLITLAVLFGPAVHDVDPQFLDYRAKNQGPSLDHPLGTDNLGRDTLAQMLAGGRISLAVGMAAMLLSLTLGTMVGVTAGYFHRFDGPLMRLTDLFLALPVLPLLLVTMMLFRDPLQSALGPEAGIFVLIVAVIGITSWMQTARIVRGQVLAIKQWEYVVAARSIGARPLRTFREVTFPNIWPAILGAFIISFILGFNNFEITFYNVAAIPTLPTIAWGTLRHGIEPELYALATIVNALVFLLLFIIYLLIRVGALRLGVPDD